MGKNMYQPEQIITKLKGSGSTLEQGTDGCGDSSSDGNQRANVLSLEEGIRRHAGESGIKAQGA